MSEHAGDVVPPRVSVDRAAGFIVAALLGPGVEEVADLPRRVAGAATVHLGGTAVVLFIGGPEMTAPELIFSSILGSRSDKLLR